jgi:hypothetical protein
VLIALFIHLTISKFHVHLSLGSSTISLLPKETTHLNPLAKVKAQPFEVY